MANNVVAYGFEKLQDVFAERVRNIDIDIIDTAITESARVYDNDLNELLSSMCERTTKFKERYLLAGSGELQPLAEDGTPIVSRPTGNYDVAYPLMRGGDAFGHNRETAAKMTVGEMNRRMLGVQTKDAKWNIRRLLAAIFTNESYTWNDEDDQVGSLTIKGLANDDTDTYIDLNGDPVTANMYSAQAAGIADGTNPYTSLYSALYPWASNLEPFVAYINPAETVTTQALSGFDPYRGSTPWVQYGVNESLAVDEVGEYLGFGNRVLGTVSNLIVVEARRIPAGYILAQALGSGPFVRMREEPEEELQGLQMVPHQVNSNHRRWDFYRKAGFGVSNRLAAAVRRIGNASYAIPTNYDARTLMG